MKEQYKFVLVVWKYMCLCVLFDNTVWYL